jgi:uncharacterized protein YciI
MNLRYAITAFDAPDGQEKRERHYPAHRAHVSAAGTYGVTVLLSGPLLEEDGATPLGSLFVLEAENRSAVEEFHRQDPFTIHGVWAERRISGFACKQMPPC